MTLYEACHELFADYPLAADAVDDSGAILSIVLVLQDGDDARFFVLLQDRREGELHYSLRLWPAGATVDVANDGNAAVPEMAANAVTRGVPMPRHGSLFGWNGEDAITALVAVFTEYASDCPQPYWAVMPLAGIPEAQWPPFTDEHFFGLWFWEYYRNGRIICLDDLIARTRGTVFWADTRSILGSDCCAVAHDIKSPEGSTLRCGRYVYYEALRAGKPVPSLRVLLAGPDKTDLAPRFGEARGQQSLAAAYVAFDPLSAPSEAAGCS
jgi:hypothetical protein